jgi:hypothetical protein
MHHITQHPAAIRTGRRNDNQISVHWSDLPKDELTRFCQDVDAGTQGNFLIAPVKN